MGVEVSHLFFVDDTLIFCDASKESLEYLSWVFLWFDACSNLKINLEKSDLIPVGDVQIMEEYAKVLGCKVGTLPSTYKTSRIWEWVEERFQKGLLCGRDNISRKMKGKY